MNTCCICVKPFKARELYVTSFGEGCPGAPLICAKCREHPAALSVAVALLKEHLDEAGHPPPPFYSGDPWALIAKAGEPTITIDEEAPGGQIQ